MIWLVISLVAVALAAIVDGIRLRQRALRVEARLNAPKPSAAQAHLMGLDNPGDQKVPITVRDWDAFKRHLWRAARALEISERQALVILEQCKHMPLCPGATIETEPCFAGCVDREKRLSALVILSAARQLMPPDARKPADAPYFAPSREYFSETLSGLAAAQGEIEFLRGLLRKHGIEPVDIPQDVPILNAPAAPAQLEEPK